MAIWRLVARPPILRAAKPDDIPVEQPTKFDLVINLTAARARSRDPAHPLARPDEVISRRSGLLRCLRPVGTNLPIRHVRYSRTGRVTKPYAYGRRDVCDGSTRRPHCCNTASHNRSGSRSPAFASSMILCATTSLAMSPRSKSRSDMSVNSYARPMTRIVSASNLWPFRWDRIGICMSRSQVGALPNSQPPTPGRKQQSVMCES